MDNDDDPIISSYSVLLKPALPAHRQLLVLQYPNTHASVVTPKTPTEVRIKPDAGMVEIDVSMNHHGTAYDRDKGVSWGTALQRSIAGKGGGSHGLAGGFGIGAPAPRGGAGRGARSKDKDDGEGGTGGGLGGGGGGDDGFYDWQEALRLDRVLRTQTFGGQVPEEHHARYMVGVFQGDQLHLTPVNSLVHLRPQLHHIDAATEQDRLKAAGPSGGGGGSGGGGKEGGGGTVNGTGGGSGGGGGGGGPAARAIHMTIKGAGGDGEEVVTETMADRLRSVQTEAWQRLTYVDEDTEDAWNAYSESLLLRTQGEATTVAAAADSGPSKSDGQDAKAAEKADKNKEVEGLDELVTTWVEGNLLRAVSGLEKSEADARAALEDQARAKQKGKAIANGENQGTKKAQSGRPKSSTVDTATETPASATATPAPPTSTGTRRGGRARPGATRGSAMEVD